MKQMKTGEIMNKTGKAVTGVCLLAVVFLMAGLMAGCGNGTSAARTISVAERESPLLAARVTAGTLPALAERLPVAADIMVETMDSTGAYGDHITMGFTGRGEQWTYGMFTEEPLFRFTMQGTVEPNVAKGYAVNADSTEYTIYLREGMKWSDGVPFTADDCIFFYEKMILPRTFGNAVYNCFYSTNPDTKERTLCTMEKVSDHEFKVKFANSSPNFLELVAIDVKWMFAPAHYYKTLLPEFIGEEAAAAKAKELGFADVAALGRQTGYYHWNNIDRPQVRPWILTNSPDSELMIMERNPYYWKTDADGRQLPYIDQVHWVRYSDVNQQVLKAMAGDFDIAGVPYTSIVPIKQNEATGGYRLLTWDTMGWSGQGRLLFNQSSEDPKLRALFASKDFRQALSIAADRKEMSELVTDGWSKPRQASPVEGAMGYSKEWAEKWTEYNPAEAKRLLEQGVGLKLGADGFFTWPDGTALNLEILTNDDTAEGARAAELLTEKYFKDIGLHATVAVRDRAYVDELTRANKVGITLNSNYDINTINISLRGDSLVPIRNNFSPWYGAFGTWLATNGASGEEPTGEILKLINLYKEMSSATTKEQINQIALQMLKVHEENQWEVGYLSSNPALYVVKNDLKNFLERGLACDEFRNLGLAHPAIFYLASDKK